MKQNVNSDIQTKFQEIYDKLVANDRVTSEVKILQKNCVMFPVKEAILLF